MYVKKSARLLTRALLCLEMINKANLGMEEINNLLIKHDNSKWYSVTRYAYSREYLVAQFERLERIKARLVQAYKSILIENYAEANKETIFIQIQN